MILFFALCGTAQAAEFGPATISSDQVRFGVDSRVTWRIPITTGDDELYESAFVSFGEYAKDRFVFSQPATDGVHFEGPGAFEYLFGGDNSESCRFALGGLQAREPFGLPFIHGRKPWTYLIIMRIPPHSSTVLVLPAALSAEAPWPGTTYAPRAQVGSTNIPLPAATAVGVLGVEMSIDTVPETQGYQCTETSPFYPAGQSFRITGHADPAIAGDAVEIFTGGPAAGEPKLVGGAIVGADGSFAFDGWTPTEPGDYAVTARYYSQRPDRAYDFAHPRYVHIDPGPPPPPPPPPVLAPELFATTVAGAFVIPNLRCLPGAATCAGTVQLHRSGRFLSRARYAIAPGAGAIVKLRLPAALRRKRAMGVVIELLPDGRVDGGTAVHRVTVRR